MVRDNECLVILIERVGRLPINLSPSFFVASGAPFRFPIAVVLTTLVAGCATAALHCT